jgi:hypothetical protein
MSFSMTREYRESSEYKQLMIEIKKECPWINQAVAEYAIIAHKTNPQAYKLDKNAKEIFKKTLEPPKNLGEIAVDNHIKIIDLNDDIIKQRQEFFEKHGISEEAELILKNNDQQEQPIIEELKA